VGGNDADPAAPDEHGQGRLEQPRQIVVERGLIDDDFPLFAPQIGGPGGEADDLETRGELDPEGEDVLAVPALVGQHHLFDLRRHPMELPGPARRVLDIFPGHILVIADVPRVHAVLAGR